MVRALAVSLVLLWPAALAGQEAVADRPAEEPLAGLPGDPTGAKFGVKVRRGQGFPPILLAAPETGPEVEEVEEVEAVQAPPVVPVPRRVRRGY